MKDNGSGRDMPEKYGLFDYLDDHPEEPEAEPALDAADLVQYADREAARQRAEDLKRGISYQLERGNAPQFILYAAIEAIGLLTSDPEWQKTQQGRLDAVYGDLMQESFIVDNASIAAARLEELQRAYNDKLRVTMRRKLAGYKRLQLAELEVINAIDAIERADAAAGFQPAP